MKKLEIYKNVSEMSLKGEGWLLKDKQFGAKDVVTAESIVKRLNDVLKKHNDTEKNFADISIEIATDLKDIIKEVLNDE